MTSTNPTTRQTLGAAAVVALGLAAAGALAGAGVARVRTADRTVTVRGLSEREARADLAIWPLRLVAADNDLAAANAQLARSLATVRTFLRAQGLDSARGTEVVLQNFEVADAATNQYGGAQGGGSRFVIRQTVIVRSPEPAAVQAASQRVAELVSAGVVLTSGGEYGQGGPTFVFTGLNALKPAMIAEATARAREGAEQFARDSRASLAGIRRASQGVFEILPRDQAPGITAEGQLVKTVRVVTTVEYGLR
ncbi:SIMPL domain-containing protein [Roseisolibacter sp. H3M3-2]|uniref:SIMPL domain-containing protein n=1 Tax=Roseisolibacter sp. H3M3-2 TaxID=3031323 RepID=UPI0023D99459|nr:SIMPL domain-containing protein [Roseisolibacter sp. H3M3-2]MDF1505018.1 SIMPL domain-containing protein [Roseisolibacter sp. H3M3-2]